MSIYVRRKKFRDTVDSMQSGKDSLEKYVVKHKSAKLLKTYAVGKLEAALNISHLILSSSKKIDRVS